MTLLPENASSYGRQIDQLFWTILLITGIFFFLVQGALLFFILRYRADPSRKALYLHGNTLVEIIWTIIPAIIVIWLTISSQRVWADVRSLKAIPPNALQVQIVAEQFVWNIRYPGPDGRFETTDDVTTINQLHLPVGRPARLKISSKDVIHSFFVAEFRIKQDAVPGLPTEVWVEPIKTGQYEIRCAELCGLGHYRMKGFVTTEPMTDFLAWLVETKANE